MADEHQQRVDELLEEVIEEKGTPILITRKGKPAAVIMGIDYYEYLTGGDE